MKSIAYKELEKELKLEGKNILIISNEPWGDVWYSKHNWANALSRKNTVYFINPPESWSFKSLFSKKVDIKKEQSNLFSITYRNKIPLSRFKFLFNWNEKIISRILRKELKKISVNNPLFWTFDPYRLISPQLLTNYKKIYFIVDKYQIPNEFTLIDNSDCLISISQDIIKNKKRDHLIISHGIGASEFKAIESTDLEITEYALYIGNIDHRLDYQFLERLFTQFPNEKFVFLGNIRNQEDESFKKIFIEHKFANVIYHEAVHFSKLKNYIAESKICLAPMKLEVHGNNINHHKLLQYLALGKPVLSAQFSDYQKSDILYTYSNSDEGVKKMKELTSESFLPEFKQKRIDYAKQFSYDSLIEKIENYI